MAGRGRPPRSAPAARALARAALGGAALVGASLAAGGPVRAPRAAAAPPPAGGAAVWAARCAACHGGRVPTQPAPLPRHAPLHAALAPTGEEAAALAAWLAEVRAARRTADPAPADLVAPARDDLERGARPALPPRWALAPWKWKNEHAGPDDVRADVAALRSHDVPCGVYLIDSPWSSGYGTHAFFAPRWREAGEARPGEGLVRELRAQGLAVVLWTTAMVNDGSDSRPAWDVEAERALWAEAEAQGLFFDDPVWDLTLGRGLAGSRIRWWKGVGSHLDLTRPAGRRLWYRLLDRALDLEVDGFKVDGGWPPLVAEYYFQTSAHVARRTGGRGVTLSRPRGGNLSSAGACWTGDEEPTWAGLRHALRRLRLAARAGYATCGSDIGGFGGGPSPELLVRWAQAMLLAGVFELGGGGVHEPWALGEACLAAYRRVAERRAELVPYLHAAAHEAHRTGRPWLRFGDDADAFAWACGEALFVAPLVEAGPSRRVTLPPGRWIRQRLGARDEAGPVVEGGRRVEVRVDGLDDAPVFVREGAVVPLEVTGDRLGHGTARSADAVTFDLWPATGAAPARTWDFRWGDAEDPPPTVVGLAPEDGALTVALAGRPLAHPRVVLRVHRRAHARAALTFVGGATLEAAPAADADAFWAGAGPGAAGAEAAVWVDAASGVTWVRGPAARGGAALARVELR